MKFKDEKMQELFNIVLCAEYTNGYSAGNNEHLQNKSDKCADNFIAYVEQHIDELTAALDEATLDDQVTVSARDKWGVKDEYTAFKVRIYGKYVSPTSIALCQRIFKEKK